MEYLSKTLILVAILVFISLALAPVKDKIDIEGEWIGGYKVKDKWVFINAHFKLEAGAIKADIDLPFEKEVDLPPTRVSIERSCVKFVILNGSDKLLFDGKCNGATISGCVKHSGKEGTFHLFRVDKIDDKVNASKTSSSQP